MSKLLLSCLEFLSSRLFYRLYSENSDDLCHFCLFRRIYFPQLHPHHCFMIFFEWLMNIFINFNWYELSYVKSSFFQLHHSDPDKHLRRFLILWDLFMFWVYSLRVTQLTFEPKQSERSYYDLSEWDQQLDDVITIWMKYTLWDIRFPVIIYLL